MSFECSNDSIAHAMAAHALVHVTKMHGVVVQVNGKTFRTSRRQK